MVDVTTGRLAIPIPEDSDPMGLLPETFRDAAVELEDQFNFLGFAAAWAGAGASNPAVGNGLFTATYKYVAQDRIRLWIGAKMGSTTTYGAGQWQFTLPVPALETVAGSGAAWAFTGIGMGYDNSASETFRIYPRILVTDNTKIGLNTDGTTAGGPTRNVSSSVPFSWATNDLLQFEFEYTTDGTDP